MSLRINHNIASINTSRYLKSNDVNLSRSLEKLSSGLKVNRAADGPASLVISEKMRAQIAGLDQAVENSETAISMLQTSEAALNETNQLLVSMRQLAIHAANEGVNDSAMLEADQAEIKNAVQSIDRIAANTQFGTKMLLDGSSGASGFASGSILEFVNSGANAKSSGEQGYDVMITENATRSSLRGSAKLTEKMVDAGEKLTVLEGGKTATYTASKNDTVETAVQNFRGEIDKFGLNVTVALEEDGTVSLQSKEYGSDFMFSASSSSAGVLSTDPADFSDANRGVDVQGTINGESSTGKGRLLTGNENAANVAGVTVRLHDSVEGLDLEKGENFKGIKVGDVHVNQNSLRFQIGGNEKQSAAVSMINVASNNLGRGISNNSNFSSLQDIDVRNLEGSSDAIEIIDQAIQEISTARGELGAFQKNTLESNLAGLRVASENLTASESIIRDADMAAEMAEFTKNSVMMQSATAMLEQANEVPKSVLNLIR